jgi:hypothetical protein
MSCPCKFLERPKHARVLEAVSEILHMVGMMLLRANSSMAIYFGVITFLVYAHLVSWKIAGSTRRSVRLSVCSFPNPSPQ